MYDYLLGGEDNDQIDRDTAEKIIAMGFNARLLARTNREFMRRLITELAATMGIRQFLDIGSGIPTPPNLHQVAQDIAPDARVVYVDNDPIVSAHADALLVGAPEGAVDFIDADFGDPTRLLDILAQRATLDLSQPVALTLIALLHFVPDEMNPLGAITTLMDALPPGSYLAISQATSDYNPELLAVTSEVYRNSGVNAAPRSRDEFSRFFDGLVLIEPGIVPPHRWRPIGIEPSAQVDAEVSMYAAVAQKPR
jgi:hypothetical protein